MAFLLLMTRIMSDVTATLLRGLQNTDNSLLIDVCFGVSFLNVTAMPKHVGFKNYKEYAFVGVTEDFSIHVSMDFRNMWVKFIAQKTERISKKKRVS
jgi:hypothetical protein